MLRMKTAVLSCLVVLITASAAAAFDYASYKPGDLDEILAMPRPKTGVTLSDLQKVALKVTLESYAQEGCSMAGVLKFSMTMLPTVYPKELMDTLSKTKCINIKSPKGSIVTVAIQDKVADFLPEEVPLGTEIQVYCLLIAMTDKGPGILVSEFEAPEPSSAEGPLMGAAARGDLAQVKDMLAKGADVNSTDQDGRTALMLAALGGRPEVAKLLIEKGADVNARMKGGSTVLMAAAMVGNAEVVRLLVEKGADVTAGDETGITVLMASFLAGHPEVMTMLVQRGLAPKDQSGDSQRAPTGASQGKNLDVVKLLVERGADINARTKDGMTALSLAEQLGRKDLVQYLKAQGAQ
ncbi:MAG: ankyrin repeat domain-containing protein [Thermodesulfobacteriota bacterium]